MCGGSWSPAGPKTHPDSFYDAETTFVAHPRGISLAQFVLFLFFVFCLFVIATRTVFYRFVGYFEDIVDAICGVFWSKVEVAFLATLLREIMIFKLPGPPFFIVFCNLFRIPFRTSFLSFFGDDGVARFPVLELVSLTC